MSQKLTIDLSGTKGLAPKFFGDANDAAGVPRRRYLGDPGQMAQGSWNPFRAFGYMAPPTSASLSAVLISYEDPTYKQSSELVATMYDSVGTTGANGKGIWAADQTTLFFQDGSGNGFPMQTMEKLTSGSPKMTDIERYSVNGVGKVFFAYQNSSGPGGDIGICSPAGSGTANATWLSATCSGGFNTGATNNVVMVPADNGYMYLLDGSSVHKIDGTTAGGASGTAYPNVLLFPPDFTLADGVDWQAHLWLAVQTTGSFAASNGRSYNERVVGVYSWDRSTTAFAIQSFIPVTGLREIRKLYVTPQGELRLIGISSERMTQIRRYNGQTFEIVQELGISAYPTYRDSVAPIGGLVTWLGADGAFYGHGKLPATQSGSLYYTPDQLFELGSMRSLAGTDFTAGAIVPFGVGTAGTYASPATSLPGIVFGYADSNGNKKTYQWLLSGTGSISGTVQYADAGSAYTLVQRLPGLCSVNWIRVWHLPNGEGGPDQVGSLSIYANQSATPLATVPITRDDVLLGYKYVPTPGAAFFSLQFEVSWPTNVELSDAADWMPYAIEVDYDPLPKKK